jgi:hypothetical protein
VTRNRDYIKLLELPKKRKIPRWDFPIMDFGDINDENEIHKSQDVQGSGSSQEACGKASKGNARKDFHD